MSAKPPGILIVDDDSELATTFGSNILYEVNSRSIPVYIFTDATKAKMFIQSRQLPLSAAIVDLWMVDQATGSEDREAGLSVMKLLRERQPKCKIVALSAHIDNEIESRLKDVFAAVPLRKPCSTAEVMDVIEPSIATK